MNNSTMMPQDTKKVFWKLGTCSRTFFYLLNRGFGHLKETEETAADPLCGGLALMGRQCGMLWGATLAVGAESCRRYGDRGQAIATAVTATQHVMQSFSATAGSVDCLDITGGCDWSKNFVFALVKYLLTGQMKTCFSLAERWAPEAIQASAEGLSREISDVPQQVVSCASEVAQRMGASDEEMVMVAGFAGGMGLSGNACGALGAAIWMKTLAWCREHPGKSAFPNPIAKRIVKTFSAATGGKILCHAICGKMFTTITEHTEFIHNGGCETVMNVFARP